jgi:hypothetical protein
MRPPEAIDNSAVEYLSTSQFAPDCRMSRQRTIEPGPEHRWTLTYTYYELPTP